MEHLGEEFTRLQRRAARQKRRIGESQLAWQRWSSTMEEVEGLVGRIVALPTSEIDGLALSSARCCQRSTAMRACSIWMMLDD